MTDRRKAVAYIRTSTKQQVLSLDAQRHAIETWASIAGVDVVAWHTDHGVSGALSMRKRAGLSAAVGTIMDDENVRVLVTAHRDRLTRDPATAGEIYHQLSLCNVEFIAVEETIADSAASKFGQHVDAALTEYLAKRDPSNHPPFGYRAEGGRLVADEGEQSVIARVRAAKRAGVSTRDIADALRDAGIVSRTATVLP
jgi:hypothetical protein